MHASSMRLLLPSKGAFSRAVPTLTARVPSSDNTLLVLGITIALWWASNDA